ncbi:MAG: GNAT family N-acetyltransferase [Bacteroidota bacterium]|nr:GNAT family N-acetyltransferase [Bacteroidota bacterium]
MYEAIGYHGGIKDEDVCFLASEGGRPIGGVRLCLENGVLVLRGMMVLPEFQRQGIGKALLGLLDVEIGDTPCYCINPPHLASFYGRIGFHRIELVKAPMFLVERLERYGREQHECIMMFRHTSRLEARLEFDIDLR